MLCDFCELPAAGGVENGYGKINILLQTYIGRGEVDSFSLISDLSYVAQVRHKHRERTMQFVFILCFLKMAYTLTNQSNRNRAIKPAKSCVTAHQLWKIVFVVVSEIITQHFSNSDKILQTKSSHFNGNRCNEEFSLKELRWRRNFLMRVRFNFGEI